MIMKETIGFSAHISAILAEISPLCVKSGLQSRGFGVQHLSVQGRDGYTAHGGRALLRSAGAWGEAVPEIEQ